MTLRTIPHEFSTQAVEQIDAAIAAIADSHDITILHAIESGSRAWGFPSPDSDYDCRFIYARPREDYLSLWPRRDVIELPINGDLDVNGWDLGKAIRLLLKGNAVVLEWLMSPIVYSGDAAVRDALLSLAERHVSRASTTRHYLHIGMRQQQLYLTDADAVPLKKIFYALRPATALRWLRLHPAGPIVPMHFPTLLTQCDLPAELSHIVAELMARKRETREMGTARLPAAVSRFLEAEFDAARTMLSDDGQWSLSDDARVDADALFRSFTA